MTHAAQEPAPPLKTRSVLLIALGHHAHDIFTSYLAPALPLIISKLGLSLTQAGGLWVFQQLPAIANPLLGVLADRIGYRWLLIAAPSLTAIAMIAIGVAPTYATLALLLIVAGVSNAAWHVPGPVAVAAISGARVGRGMSLFMLGGETARAVGPLVLFAAVSAWGLEGIWRTAPLGLLASLMLSLWLPRDAPSLRPAAEARIAPRWRTWCRVMAPIAGVITCRAFMIAALTTFLPTFLTTEGSSLWFATVSLVILEAAGAAGVLVSGTVSDLIGRRRVLFIVMTLSPVLMIAFLSSSGARSLPVLLLLGFLALSTSPVLLAVVQEHLPSHPAAANGVFMTISFLVRALVVLAVGLMADRWGLRPTFYACAALGLVGLPAAYLLPRRTGAREAGR